MPEMRGAFMECIATAAFGLEGLVKQELQALGIPARGEMGGARFEASPGQIFESNLSLRTADRVLIVAGEEKVTSFEALFQFVSSLPWEDYLPRDARFPVSGKCARSQLMSVRDCQAITKKAIAERLKKRYRVSWCEESGPLYPIDVSLHGDTARLTIDSSGDALNRRGYRTWTGEAPFRETLAAALVMLAPQDGSVFYDPCCGSGTLLIEAAYLRARRAPGLTRRFACEDWPSFPRKEMEALRQKAFARFDPSLIGSVSGSDIDPEALKLCKRHIRQAGLDGRITVTQKDLRDLTLSAPHPLFLLNPPYGERLSDRKACERLYRDIRGLYDRHPGCRMGVITAHTGFERCFGQHVQQKRRLYNGRLECEYLLYGAKKPNHTTGGA